MAVKKTEIYSSLWAGCDELRGGMDASQYKDYVLTLLFMKYVSDKYAGDEDSIIFVPKGATFDDLVALKGDKEIGDKINKVISNLAEENELKGVIDVADFNNEDKLGKGKEMVDRLSRLVAIFNDLDLSANRAEGDDLLGDAYEYLMRHFATESGKSKGQFYTPAEVSRVVANVLAIPPDTSQDATVYDPTCGSGSLLLKVADESPHGLTIYGQEMDNSTVALARMNMFMHNYPTAEIWQDNTLSSPYWKDDDGGLKTFDFAVANPPFSYKSWSNGINPSNDEFNRFEYGAPPAKNGDYAFLLHILKSLKSTGKAAVILPHGVLFRGNAEATIRLELVRRGYIKGIIGLPANLFYGTGIPACIIVIDKGTAAKRQGLFMVDGSKAFIKDGNKNRLRSQDIHKIVDVFNNQIELPRYSRMVDLEEIAETVSARSGIPKINREELSQYFVALPPLPEQQAIATTLSNIDNLITALEKLIAKKRHIKTATMQQLLTGKKRLPGFGEGKGYKNTEIGVIPEDWEVEALGQYIDINSGESPSKYNFIDQGIPYFKVEQLNNDSKYLKTTSYYIKGEKTVSSGSLIFPKRGVSILLNKVRILAQDSFMDTNLMSITTSYQVDGEYLYYFLQHTGLSKVADTTSIPQINNKHIIPFLIPFPSLPEQKAIATILSNQDEEITALEKRLTKTKAIRQGMMQELLTGKTRLI